MTHKSVIPAQAGNRAGQKCILFKPTGFPPAREWPGRYFILPNFILGDASAIMKPQSSRTTAMEKICNSPLLFEAAIDDPAFIHVPYKQHGKLKFSPKNIS